ncbi:hypothetical protein [Streptomyces sp. NPDC018833]|uniref:Rv1733c family protein n=1 Tax=Streptomyces sp. NPDC018833 TaxID=3365053 RepID=UPI0037B605F7
MRVCSRRKEWRCHPLRRRVDVLEARVLLAVAGAVCVLAPAVGATAGAYAYTHDQAVAAAQNASRHQVRAVVLRDAPDPAPQADATQRLTKVAVPVRWTTADGTSATGTAAVRPGTERGEPMSIWLDRAGRITTAPLNSGDIWAGALFVGLGGAALTVSAGAVAAAAVRAVWNRRRAAEWQREWKEVEPAWSRLLS